MLALVMVPGCQGSAIINRHWGGRRVSSAAQSPRHSSQSAVGPRGTSGDARGSRTRWNPVTQVTSCVCRKACTPSRASGARRDGRGTGVAP